MATFIQSTRSITQYRPLSLLLLCGSLCIPTCSPAQDSSATDIDTTTFQNFVKPAFDRYCVRCHNVDEMMSGIRVDHLDGTLPEHTLRLWNGIRHQVEASAMPPDDEPQPTPEERRQLIEWITRSLNIARSRPVPRNGLIRRLTVSQYRNALRELLHLEDDFTDILPPDGVSRDGFLNNTDTLSLSPLLIEAYFTIAEQALDRCIIDNDTRPVIQNFRIDLGDGINPAPCPDSLILGALSRLLDNDDFMVTQLTARKPFDFTPFQMRTHYRFIEGYQGNDTVRGWRDYDSIYHAVFACMRGTDGYPKGDAYNVVPNGLLLRPAIPSAEIFQVESTYGPRANFKISLRELPDFGRFRVTVKAARYGDGLLLDPADKTASAIPEASPPIPQAVTVTAPQRDQTVSLDHAGVYQVDVYPQTATTPDITPDASRLHEGLVGAWHFDGNTNSSPPAGHLQGKLAGDTKLTDTPFGQGLALDGNNDSFVVPRHESMNVDAGEFTVAAWIKPHELRQSGIVCLGKYSWTHGWYFDMPNNQGVLRIETAGPDSMSNGTVATRPGMIRPNVWQHVTAVVRRGENQTRLYLNGYQVASGTIGPDVLDNPRVNLHIGRIQDAQQFKGEIDEVYFFKRALVESEIQALIEPGRSFATPPPPEKPQSLTLTLNGQQFSGTLHQPAFLAIRLPAGPLQMKADYAGGTPLANVVLTPLPRTSNVFQRFESFEQRSPSLGVHVGLRRDCGSTLSQVGRTQRVTSTELRDFVFEGAIANFPSPDVEKDNVNYLAGIREIGIRSEYSDGRDMPRLLVRSVEFEGPYYETWPPQTHASIFTDFANKADEPAYARHIIHSFARRAFRRPATNAEVDMYCSTFETSRAGGASFVASVKDALLIILTSPQFLFLIEQSETPDGELIDDYELASKLSFFLWNSPPDDELLQRAADQSLHRELDNQTSRMIDDPRFGQFIHEFAGQWLSLDKLDVVEIDRNRFPRLTRDVREQLRHEPAEFLQYLIRNNLPARHLVMSDLLVANETVAAYYGLAERTNSGFQFVPIQHERKELGGLLTHAGVLAGLSDGRESNPVKRGAWLARKIIAEPPDDPPPNVPDLSVETEKLPLRERLEIHRNQPGCAKCHSGIDPWGLPFEQYGADGLFKTQPVDVHSTLPDQHTVANVIELKKYLADVRIDQVAFSFMHHLATYACGRTLSYNEIDFLKQNGRVLKVDGYHMQDIIRFVIHSDLFLKK